MGQRGVRAPPSHDAAGAKAPQSALPSRCGAPASQRGVGARLRAVGGVSACA